MDLISRVHKEIRKIKKNGDIPSIIWMGVEERKEFESYIKDLNLRMMKDNKIDNKKKEFLGLSVEFVNSKQWLSITIIENKK